MIEEILIIYFNFFAIASCILFAIKGDRFAMFLVIANAIAGGILLGKILLRI